MAATKRPRSEGAVQLGKLALTDEDLAARLGCSRQQVNYWKTGKRVPQAKWRARMATALGIAPDSWDRIPEPAKARQAARGARQDAPPPASPPHDYEPVTDDGSVRAKAARLDRLVRKTLDTIERGFDAGDDDAKGGLTEVEQIKLATDAHRLLDKLGRLTGETLQIPESRILRLPAWRRIQEQVLGALAPHPKALAAVVRELEQLGGEV